MMLKQKIISNQPKKSVFLENYTKTPDRSKEKGSNGEVSYWTEKYEKKQQIAVKTSRVNQTYQRQLFIREVEALKKLKGKSDNIIQIITSNTDTSPQWMAMIAEKDCLIDMISHQSYNKDDRQVFTILYSLIEATEFIHEHSILHRDIKPDNILIRNGTKVILCDFGSAIDLENPPPEESHTILKRIGTQKYKAIELFSELTRQPVYDQGKKIKPSRNKKVDIYSIGAVAYVLIEEKYFIDYDTPYTSNQKFIESLKNLEKKCKTNKDLELSMNCVTTKFTEMNPYERPACIISERWSLDKAKKWVENKLKTLSSQK